MFSRLRLAWQNGPGRALNGLPLADRFLLLFFLVLLAGSADMLLWPQPGPSGEIDVIVRTSSASVFGYLLSGGLSPSAPAASRSAVSPETLSPTEVPPPGREMAGMPADPSPAPDPLPDPAAPAGLPSGPVSCSRIQILTAAGVGIFCLGALLLLRGWPGRLDLLAASDSATAVLVQFRDFISGSLGYLIGCSSRQTDSPSS